MEFPEAITILAQGRGSDPTVEWDEQIDIARSVVTKTVLVIIGGSDDDGRLGDWISAGYYTGKESAESIAKEYLRAN